MMGYDLSGLKPTSIDGQRFSGGLFRWADLVHLCIRYFPEEVTLVCEWYGPDCYGNGLDSDKSARLASKLRTLISAGDGSNSGQRSVDYGLICDEECIREFIRFLESCGGFSIS